MRRSTVRWRANALLVSLLLVLTAFDQINAVKSRIECYVDDKGDKEDPNNIYNCDLTQRCCKESALPSCCSDKPTEKAVEDQLQLWGAVAGIILVVAIVMFYCRHDGDCCSNRKDGSTRCCGGCCCPKRRMEEGYTSKEQEANRQKDDGIVRPGTPRPRPPPYDDLAADLAGDLHEIA